MLSKEEIIKQSEGALRQWGAQWTEHAARNGKMYAETKHRLTDLYYYGIGKTLLCCATGASLEKNIDIIKKYRGRVDIIANDKSLGCLVSHGITPDYVIVADANVNYDKFCGPYIDSTDTIKLVINVCANPEWAEKWKGPVYFHLNKDTINTEKTFGEISGVKEILPASSNVGNSMVVLAGEYLGYDKVLLVGYDFAWTDEDKYYAFDDSDKRYYMRHVEAIDSFGNFTMSSVNLLFSFRWLTDYITMKAQQAGMRTFNCSGQGLLNFNNRSLETMMQLSKPRELTPRDVNTLVNAHKKVYVVKDGAEQLKQVIETNNVYECAVTTVPDFLINRIKGGKNESKILRP